mmetsp:Transcript_62409/g.172930  ORF Transcript_62409/g.172930 Transcript_62409/m.172930 type:complete len:253 (-) Transcript_62409:503-1261(-)
MAKLLRSSDPLPACALFAGAPPASTAVLEGPMTASGRSKISIAARSMSFPAWKSARRATSSLTLQMPATICTSSSRNRSGSGAAGKAMARPTAKPVLLSPASLASPGAGGTGRLLTCTSAAISARTAAIQASRSSSEGCAPAGASGGGGSAITPSGDGRAPSAGTSDEPSAPPNRPLQCPPAPGVTSAPWADSTATAAKELASCSAMDSSSACCGEAKPKAQRPSSGETSETGQLGPSRRRTRRPETTARQA